MAATIRLPNFTKSTCILKLSLRQIAAIEDSSRDRIVPETIPILNEQGPFWRAF